jgi:hypothetical protein
MRGQSSRLLVALQDWCFPTIPECHQFLELMTGMQFALKKGKRTYLEKENALPSYQMSKQKV